MPARMVPLLWFSVYLFVCSSRDETHGLIHDHPSLPTHRIPLPSDNLQPSSTRPPFLDSLPSHPSKAEVLQVVLYDIFLPRTPEGLNTSSLAWAIGPWIKYKCGLVIFEALARRRVQRHLACISEGEFSKNQGDYKEAAVVTCQWVVAKSNE